jgi:predicted transcriptional regulator
MTRRSRLELIHDILLAVQNKGGKIRPTQLMYKSNLSHKLLKNYMAELVEKELISVVDVQKKKSTFKEVHLTVQGHEFIAEYRRMQDFTRAFGL